ncbi:MFS transporter [Haloprofundus marisrubri]|uniref:MFS transporter n=1 Tax=Haloprofundus marisrubri TaxID=1514971 RepID=A0A0W1R9U1_9EURY|nr:MFS transporter [Haloprofundus marisrubri]KTG10404.1 MFS transporter [Haloprofundus marisrubri]
MRTPSLDAVRGFRRPVYLVALGQLVNLFGSGLVYPFATVHFHLEVGISLGVVGFGLLLNNVATAVGTAVGGFAADRIGRKPVMVTSMALSTVTLAAYAAVSTATGFVAVATAAGLTLGLFPPASQAMIADLTDGSERDRAFALLKVANNAGFGLGFVAGGVLYSVAQLAVFVADGLTCGVVAVLLWATLPRVRGGREDEGDPSPDAKSSLSTALSEWRRAVTRPRIVTLALLNVGFAVMYAQMQATVPVVATETLGLSSAELGTLYVLNPLVIVTLQLPLVAAIADWRRTRGLVVSAGFWAAAMLAVWVVVLGPFVGVSIPVVVGVALVGAFLVLRTLGEILHAPLVSSLASDISPERERGSGLSLVEIAKRLGFGIGAALGGAFFDFGIDHWLWPTLAVGCVGLAVGVLALERRVTPAENGVSNTATTAD